MFEPAHAERLWSAVMSTPVCASVTVRNKMKQCEEREAIISVLGSMDCQ